MLITVVAAVVQKGDRYLLCRRPVGKRHAGMWEFPGGKVLQGEAIHEAVARELAEELGVQTRSVGDELGRFQDVGTDFLIRFLRVEITGEPVAHEHEAIGWFSVGAMQELQLAPADRALADTLSHLQSAGQRRSEGPPP